MTHLTDTSRMPICALLAALACVECGELRAQPGIEPGVALAECTQIDDDDARLTCYDSLLRVAPQDPDAAGSAVVAIKPNAMVSSSDEPQQRRERHSRARRDRPSKTVEQAVVVVDVKTGISDLHVFTMRDGRIYAQTSTDSVRLSGPPFGARLEPAAFGSFFLIPDGSRQRIRVSLRE